MMGGMMGGGMGIGMILSWIFWLVILAMIVYAMIWFARQSSAQTQSSETPLAILKRRFAAGEIDQTQYDSLKSQLS